MLSRKERELLKDPASFTGKQRRTARWRIKKKIGAVAEDLQLITSSSERISIEVLIEVLQNYFMKASKNSETSQFSEADAKTVRSDDLSSLENW